MTRDDLIGFIDELSLEQDVYARMESFRTGLCRLLPAVDHVAVNINLNYDLPALARYQAILVSYELIPHEHRPSDILLFTARDKELENPSGKLIEGMIRKGFPIDEYHPPLSFDYCFGDDQSYLGTIFLWQEKSRQPDNASLQREMERLHTLIVLLLSASVDRYFAANPIERAYFYALAAINREAKLTLQENRCAILRFHGLEYKEAAEHLGVSDSAVRKYMGNVHRKTGTHSLGDLIFKYMTPAGRRLNR